MKLFSDPASMPEAAASHSATGRVVLVAGVAMLIGAGAAMWMAQGPAIFVSMLSAAIAWCL